MNIPWLCKGISCGGGGGCGKGAGCVVAGLNTAVNKSSTSFPPSSAKKTHCAWAGWHCLQTLFYESQLRLEHVPGILYSLPRIAPGQNKHNTEWGIIKRCNKINSATKSK